MSKEIKLNLRETNRGFDIIEFEDSYARACSIQETISAVDTSIWFGVVNPEISGGRMLLSREHVIALLPHLQSFADTGELVKIKPAQVENKYAPFIDVDKNGAIIITPFSTLAGKLDPNEMMFINISGQFNGKGLSQSDPDRHVSFDFQNKVGKSLSSYDIHVILTYIDHLYSNVIDSLCLRNLPQMNYSILAGTDVSNEGAVQWDRKDFIKLSNHIKLLYQSSVPLQ